MKKYLFILSQCFFLTIISTAFASEKAGEKKLRIFACEPEWGSLAKEIGGDKLEIKNATIAIQDAHHLQAKPSLIAAIRKADMVFCTGIELEIGWLPILLAQAGNSDIQIGGKGYFMAGDFVQKLEIPVRLDRIDGDVHPNGNPHIQSDPRNIAIIAKAFTAKIKELDPKNAAFYQTRYDKFNQKFQDAIKTWQKEAVSLKGMRIVVQHNNWVYLVNWLGLEVVASLEPKPGVPPSGAYLAEIMTKLESNPAKLIIYAPFESDKAVNWLKQKTGIPAIMLPFTVGGNEESDDLFALFDSTIALLKQGSSKKN